MEQRIIARRDEIKTLDKLFNSGKSEFLAVYGRRRVGKTFLIREFFRNKGIYFHITGIKDAPVRKQLRHFAEEFKRVFKKPITANLKDWQDAFTLLQEAIDTLPGSERIILFFDELPWMSTHRSGFLQDLDHLWNRHLSDNNRVLLVVCGSVAAWMIKKVIQNKGGLHGRLTATLQLKPFDLCETEEFLKSQNIVLDRKQIVEIYMAIGGIPKYLTYAQQGLSSLQIINKICFTGALIDEFNELYSSLFENHERYVTVIRALAKKNQGLTKTEIFEETKIPTGGGMNAILEDLLQSGFIMVIPNPDKTKKNLHYRLIDEYSLFYLRWIEKAKTANIGGIDPHFWHNMSGSFEAKAWSGYAFEGICLKHTNALKKSLGISGIITQTSGWIYKATKESSEKGAQIDLVIDRADNCINLCEIKFTSDIFVISKDYESDLRHKKTIFAEKLHTKKTIFLTFITPYGISKKAGYFGIVDKELTLDDLFLSTQIQA